MVRLAPVVRTTASFFGLVLAVPGALGVAFAFVATTLAVLTPIKETSNFSLAKRRCLW